jgi:hypothetical protein
MLRKLNSLLFRIVLCSALTTLGFAAEQSVEFRPGFHEIFGISPVDAKFGAHQLPFTVTEGLPRGAAYLDSRTMDSDGRRFISCRGCTERFDGLVLSNHKGRFKQT